MKILHTLCVLSLLLLIGNCGGNIWREMAQKDLNFVYATLKKNHPGAANPVQAWEPEFGQWLEQGYQEAIKSLTSVSDYQSYKYLLLGYVRGFLDNHLWVHIKNKKKNLAEHWKLPFEYAYTGKDVMVTESLDQRISSGDVLVSVDGVPTKQFLAKLIIHFYTNSKLEASYYKATRFLYLLPMNPFVSCPKTYTFKTNNGKFISYSTQWEKTTEGFSLKKLSEFSLKKLKNDCVWISLPNFYPNSDQEKKINHIISIIKNYRNSNAIIFDLRNNCGGNSNWGISIVKALVGKKYFAQREPTNLSIYWRSSKGNLAHIKKIQKKYRMQFAPENQAHEWIKNAVEGTEKAHLNNEPFFIETMQKKEKTTSSLHSSLYSKLNPSTIVICIINEYCVSASLDFLDALQEVTNPILVGHPTSSDTNFMDIREMRLPSDHGSLFIPMKFYVGRKRKSNQCYVPDIHIYDTMQDTQKLQAYVIDTIVKQLD